MKTLTLRSYREQDLPAIAHLINTCETVDQLDAGTSVTELQTEFSSPSLNLKRDLRLWEDADGTLVAFAQLWVSEAGASQDVSLWFKVLPAARNQGLEEDVIAWAEAQTRQISRDRHCPGTLQIPIRATQIDSINRVTRLGYQVQRHFLRLERSLHEPIPAVQLPAGFVVRSLVGATEIPAWVDAFNQSFIDHWNHHNLSLDERLHWLTTPTYTADLDLVAIAPDGTFAAVCLSEIEPERNLLTGRNEGFINILGTRRGFRRLGLGRAILLIALQQLKTAGMDSARLGVDADNPMGARQLYESVGFHPVFASMVFCKQV